MIFMKEIKDGKIITTIGEQITIEITEFNSFKQGDTYTTIVSCPSKEELDKWEPANEPQKEEDQQYDNID